MYQELRYLGLGTWEYLQRLIPPGEGCSEVGPAAIVMEAAGSGAGAGEWHCCHPVTLRAPVLTPPDTPWHANMLQNIKYLFSN